MSSPYSQDLRLRVLASLDGGMSKMAAHRTFRVSRSTIDDWLRLREQTGSVTPNTTYRRGTPPAIADLEAFTRFARRHSGSTLSQMAQAWHEETGQKLSINTFSLALGRIGWTRKKRVFSTANAIKTSAMSSYGS